MDAAPVGRGRHEHGAVGAAHQRRRYARCGTLRARRLQQLAQPVELVRDGELVEAGEPLGLVEPEREVLVAVLPYRCLASSSTSLARRIATMSRVGGVLSCAGRRDPAPPSRPNRGRVRVDQRLHVRTHRPLHAGALVGVDREASVAELAEEVRGVDQPGAHHGGGARRRCSNALATRRRARPGSCRWRGSPLNAITTRRRLGARRGRRPSSRARRVGGTAARSSARAQASTVTSPARSGPEPSPDGAPAAAVRSPRPAPVPSQRVGCATRSTDRRG